MKLLIAFLILFCAGCGTTSNVPSAIGVKTLTSYIPKTTVPTPDSINYMFFTKQDAFINNFVMTKATQSTAITPDFTSQSVIAIVCQPSTDILELRIIKAEIVGKEMNVYYELIKTAGKTYSQTTSVVATVPKAQDVTKVTFISGTTKQKTIPVSI